MMGRGRKSVSASTQQGQIEIEGTTTSVSGNTQQGHVEGVRERKRSTRTYQDAVGLVSVSPITPQGHTEITSVRASTQQELIEIKFASVSASTRQGHAEIDIDRVWCRERKRSQSL